MAARAAAVVAVAAAALAVVRAQGGAATVCSPGPAAAATVLAILLLLCLSALAFVLYLYVWRPRHVSGLEKVNLTEEGREEGRFAFDNPFLVTDDDDIGRKSTLPCDTVLSQNEKTNTARSTDSRGNYRSPFNVVSPTSKVTRQFAADDSAIAEPERVVVPLRGHDFTGLGFNVCGNMRDGILIRDVTQRGPAAESGLIKAGDRVVGLTVSFEHIVLEDALTILSYASPYEVQLHVQKESATLTTPRRPQLASLGGATGQHLVHPLYRSQSHTQLHKRCWTNYPLESPQSSRGGKPGKHLKPDKSKSKLTEKQVSRASPREPRVDSERNVHRDATAAHVTEASAGYREMAVDVPDHMVNNSHGNAGPSKHSKFGVKVLPLPESSISVQKITQSGAHQPGGKSRDNSSGTPETAGGDVSIAAAPTLRTFIHDAKKCKDVDKCLTIIANDIPCCKLADNETGEPLMTPQHRKHPVLMDTASFNRQDSIDLDLSKEVSDTEDSTTFKIPGEFSRATISGEVQNNVKPADQTLPESSRAGWDITHERLVDDNTPHPEEPAPPVPPHAAPLTAPLSPPVGDVSGTICRDDRQGSSSSNSSSSSGVTNGELMQLAAGAVQDRRNRAERRAAHAAAQRGGEVSPGAASKSHGSVEATENVQSYHLTSENNMVSGDMGSRARMPYAASVNMTAAEETEVTKVVWSANQELENVTKNTGIDKLEAFKEILLMTPPRTASFKRDTTQEADIVGEKVERNLAQRSPDMSGSSSRITGEVTGVVSVGVLPTRHTSPATVIISDSNGHSEMLQSPASSLASPVPPIPPARRLISEEGERISASTGDLSRLEERAPDSSSLERAVSLHMPAPEPSQQAGSVAACEGPQMDLSQVGRREAAGPRRNTITPGKPVENGTTLHHCSSPSSPALSSDEEEMDAEYVVTTRTNGPSHHYGENSSAIQEASTSTVASLATASISVNNITHTEPQLPVAPPPVPPTTRELSPTRAGRSPPVPAPRSAPSTPHASLMVSAEGDVLVSAVDQREEFHITPEELDGQLISHGSYLRREAERRAQACRQAGEHVRAQEES